MVSQGHGTVFITVPVDYGARPAPCLLWRPCHLASPWLTPGRACSCRSQECTQKVTERELFFVLKKAEDGPYWNRLLKKGLKKVGRVLDRPPVCHWLVLVAAWFADTLPILLVLLNGSRPTSRLTLASGSTRSRTARTRSSPVPTSSRRVCKAWTWHRCVRRASCSTCPAKCPAKCPHPPPACLRQEASTCLKPLIRATQAIISPPIFTALHRTAPHRR